MRLGAHVPTRGSLPAAVDYAVAAGCQAFQMFVSNPRGWAPPAVPPALAREFIRRRGDAGLGPVYVHASYLVNIASSDRDFRRRSVELASRELDAAGAIGADGLVIHAGSGGRGERAAALERAAASVRAIVEAGGPPVVLELTAGGVGTVASTIPQAAELFQALEGLRDVRLCLDTCHLFAAGAPLDSPSGARQTLGQLRTHRLARRVGLIHANDARDPRGSRRDRHEHVGRGRIGEASFRVILLDPAVRRSAVLVESRGDLALHRRDVATLHRLAEFGTDAGRVGSATEALP